MMRARRLLYVCGVLLTLTGAGCGSEDEPQARRGTGDLFRAIGSGDITAVQSLCEAGVDVHRRRDGLTPLQWAAGKKGADGGGCEEIVEILLDNGARISEKDARGWTALHVGAMNGNVDTVKLLVARGADATVEDRMGYTPLEWAQRRNQTAVVGFLQHRDD